MPVKIITKQVFECTCACPSHPDCPHKVKPWTTDKIPARCARCQCRTWNRKSRRPSKEPPLTLNGETLTIPEWTRKLGLSRFAIPWRIKQGWPLEQVLSSEDWRLQKCVAEFADDEGGVPKPNPSITRALKALENTKGLP